MWDLLFQQSFLVGATLVVIYQAAKFTELNLADPVTSRYAALMPDANVRDFAGSVAYRVGLITFLGLSLLVYFLLCQISPDVLKGATRLLTQSEPPAALKDIPYPLYIAALFVGLTQPIIPIFSQFVNAQRDFFHNRINVPRRVIDFAEALTRAVEARSGADKRSLAIEVRKLTGAEFVTILQTYSDGAYYKLQLEKLDLGDENAIGHAVKDSSAKELRILIERLILYALVATMRRSGPKNFDKVAETLDVAIPPAPANPARHLIASFVSSAVLFALALLILANVFCFLVDPVAKLFPDQDLRLWPEDFPNAIAELWYIVPPIFVSLLVAVYIMVPQDRSQTRDIRSNPQTSLGTEFVEFFRSSAVVLSICISITMLIWIGQYFYEYGISGTPPATRTAAQLMLPAIKAFISVTVCLFTTWYLVSSDAHPPRRGLSFKTTVLVIIASTALVGFFYELTFVKDYVRANPNAAPGWDHVLFGVLANALVSVAAFASIALFFKARERLPEAARPSKDRLEAPPSRNQAKRPRHAMRKISRRANTYVNANGHADH